MNKLWLIAAIIFIFCSSAFAQPMLDEMLGRYVLIYDSTHIWPDGNGGYDYVRKFISEVQLDEEGRSALSRPATPILSKDDKIEVAAYTRLASGEMLYADTSDMVTRTMPGDKRWIFVNFRQAEPGAVLHMEWLLTSKEANIAGKRFLGRTVPVERAVIIMTVPETWVFNFALSTGVAAEHQVEITPAPGGPPIASYFWVANNIPSLLKEEFSPPVERLIPCLYFAFDYDKGVVRSDTIRVDWAYLSELYYQELRAFVRSNSRLNPVIDSISDQSSDKREMARMAYAWLGGNFRPFGSEIALNGNVNEAIERGSGTQAEAGAILFALFEKLGIPAMVYLAATKDVGEPIAQVPALFWFDRLLLTAAFDEDTVWVDPYYQLAQMDILPFEDQGVKALCVTEAGGRFVDIPAPDYQENGKALHLRLEIDSTGSMGGEATEIYSGAMIPEITSFLRGLDEAGRQVPWEKKLARTFPSARINRFVVLPPDSAGQVFRIGYSFSTGPIIRPFADRAYIPLDLLGRWADLPNLNSKSRRTPIEIRRPRFELERISLKIEYPFEVEYLPNNYSENLDIGDIYSVIRGDTNSVTITRGLGLKKSSLPFSEYNSLRNFLAKARAEADKNIILRRLE
jgi:hypothetical protein